MTSIDVEGLRDRVKAMYRDVADDPTGTFHFEMGYGLAVRFGYPATELDQIPPEAIESSVTGSYPTRRRTQRHPSDRGLL